MIRRPYAPLFKIHHLSDAKLGYLLDCLFYCNIDILRNNPNFPLIYGAGVKYQHDGNDDPWQDAEETYLAKNGDCEDFACWRAAELQVRFGIPAVPCFIRKPKADGGELVHIFVRLPGNRFEDPSRILGMR